MKRIRGSLTLRIFLITAALMLAACAATYAAIACLTPISYTSLLRDELQAEAEALAGRLQSRASDGCAAELEAFARQTGAQLRVVTQGGTVLYNTLLQPVVEDAVSMVMEAPPGVSAVAGTSEAASDERAYASFGGVSEEALAQSAEGAATNVVIGDASVVQDGDMCDYPLVLRDGVRAVLTVQGGRRAVNQASEAMRRMLPYLALLLLGFSAAGAFLYARVITRPIVALSGVAKRIASLDFHARWKGARRDEIGLLGDSLNQLSDNLQGALGSLRAANEALKQDIERERELDRQRLAFFSAASHELKTPVTILKGQLSGMLAQVGVYANREKYLARALEVTGRMEGLIREILTISRVESGVFSPGSAAVNLSGLLQNQLALDEELLWRAELSLETHIEPGLMVRGSERLLRHAVDNVLTNAIQYSPPGERVCVAACGRVLTVENTGASIPPDALDKLFTPFYRVEQSRSRRLGGSGLGLYLVRCVLAAHGAECRMENTAQGVRFTAVFPAYKEETNDGLSDALPLAAGNGAAGE